MALNDGQIPKLANILNSGVGILTGATVAGVVGTNTGGQTVYTPGGFGGRVYSLLCSTTVGVAASVITIYILKGGTTVMPLGIVNLAASTGSLAAGTTKNADLLNNVQILGLPVDNTGKLYIPLKSDEVLRTSYITLASGNAFVVAMGLDYQS